MAVETRVRFPVTAFRLQRGTALKPREENVDDEGFEPSTFRMQNGRSTTELNALDQIMARVPRQTPLAPGIEPGSLACQAVEMRVY